MAPRKKSSPSPDNVKAGKSRATLKKKKAAVGEEAAVTLSLTEMERLHLRTYMAEYRHHNTEATLRLVEKQDLQRKLDPDNKLGLLDQAIRAASEGAARAQGQHNETLQGIEKRLNIEIKNFSFDAETGRLFPHQADNAAPTKE
jgi:hypothetical protein